MRLLCLVLGAVSLQAQFSTKEVALGAYILRDMQRDMRVIDSPEIHDYLARLSRKFADGAFHFTVIRDPLGGSTHEPLVLPGGYFIVPATLILATQDESELAGMLAHCIAHTKSLGRVHRRVHQGMHVFMGGWNSWNGGSMLLPIGMQEKQAGKEFEADREAVRMLAAEGYDPESLARYLERLQLDTDGSQPPRDLRLAALREEEQKIPFGFHRQSSPEFERIQGQLAGELAPALASLRQAKRPTPHLGQNR